MRWFREHYTVNMSWAGRNLIRSGIGPVFLPLGAEARCKASINLDASDYNALVTLARKHGFTVSATFRALINAARQKMAVPAS